MYKTKIFFGTINNQADELCNDWLDNNPNIMVLKFCYEMARYGDHSICIYYKENTEE